MSYFLLINSLRISMHFDQSLPSEGCFGQVFYHSHKKINMARDFMVLILSLILIGTST